MESMVTRANSPLHGRPHCYEYIQLDSEGLCSAGHSVQSFPKYPFHLLQPLLIFKRQKLEMIFEKITNLDLLS